MRKGLVAAVLLVALVAGYGGVAQMRAGLDRFAADGCAISSDGTLPLAARVAERLGWVHQQGDWLLLGPSLCTIVPPYITPEISAGDPDVAPFISAVDANPEMPGCFADTEAMEKSLVLSRGWTEEHAYRATMSMLAAGIISGEWRFYGEDFLATPLGFQLTTGVCGNVPYAEGLKKSHEDMIAGFDSFLRINAPGMACKPGAQFGYLKWVENYTLVGQGPVVNAWQFLEVGYLLTASEWVDGVSLRGKGMPRPPICVPEDMIPKE